MWLCWKLALLYSKLAAFVPPNEPIPSLPSTNTSMTRRKNADTTVKPGKKSWASGTKLKFLQSHNGAWLSSTARSPDAAGTFYSQVTKLWFKKYGWSFEYENDLDEDTPDPTPESLLEPEEPVDDAEAARRKKCYNDMRAVSISKKFL